MNDEDPHRYDDILNLHRPVNPRRKPMSLSGRAAQFAPFAALSGFEDAVDETARETDSDTELCEDRLAELSEILRRALEREARPRMRISYFVPDINKDGGELRYVSHRIKYVDTTFGEIIFENGESISLKSVRDLKPE